MRICQLTSKNSGTDHGASTIALLESSREMHHMNAGISLINSTLSVVLTGF